MLAASIFDHPGFLLLFVFIALVRWLISKAKTENRPSQAQPPSPPPSLPIPRGDETRTEEERIRKFLEALGQPAGTTPPKVTPRRRAAQPTVFPRVPQLKRVPPPMPEAPAMPPPLPLETPAWSPAVVSAPIFEVREVARQTSSEPVAEIKRAPARFAGRIKLGTPQDLRAAIVLREIFGPPRSLQGFDSTGAL